MAKPLRELELYKLLKAKGFPQGGAGNWLIDPKDDKRYYIPRPEEVFTQFLGDPKDYQALTDALARAWIENQ